MFKKTNIRLGLKKKISKSWCHLSNQIGSVFFSSSKGFLVLFIYQSDLENLSSVAKFKVYIFSLVLIMNKNMSWRIQSRRQSAERIRDIRGSVRLKSRFWSGSKEMYILGIQLKKNNSDTKIFGLNTKM